MSYPNTGSTPSQDPNSYGQGSPGTGSQPTSSWDAQSSATGGQYGQSNDTQQYGGQQGYGQQYGGQQGYGQQGFQNAPQAFGGGNTSGARPGSATAAAVMGFIFGGLGVVGYGFWLISLTGATEEAGGAMFDSTSGGFVTILLWLWVLGSLAASIMVILGAAQILNGKSNKLLALSCIVYVVSQLCLLIAIFASGADGVAVWIVAFLISCIFAGILLYMAKSSDVEKWLARKAQARAAGYED